MPAGELLRSFISAYETGDADAMRPRLDPELVAYVTNAEAGVDRVDGPDGFLARLPDLTGAQLALRVSQAVDVAPDQALVMVEVRASRQGQDLHNFAAFLGRERDGRLVELWMVDAKPAGSDEFWS